MRLLHRATTRRTPSRTPSATSSTWSAASSACRAEPGHRHLDIGCGWGSLSLHAAETTALQVVGVTIAAEQKAFIDARGSPSAACRTWSRSGCRTTATSPDGPFDTISSIEMGEHVGAAELPRLHRADPRPAHGPAGARWSSRCRAPRRPGGGPFIEAFIAPDMHMRPVGETVACIEQAGLEVRDVHALREHYVRTVRRLVRAPSRPTGTRVVALVGEEVARVWRLYLVGGALAFEEGRMGVDQILVVKPTRDGSSGLPPVRTAR